MAKLQKRQKLEKSGKKAPREKSKIINHTK